MIIIKNIDHVVLRTSQLNKMLQFYCELLSCEIERVLPDIGLTQLRAGSALIDLVDIDSELGRVGGGPPTQKDRNLEHLCLLIERVDESDMLDYLQHEGIACGGFDERYGATGYGRSIYINDPEGNVVELKLENKE